MTVLSQPNHGSPDRVRPASVIGEVATRALGPILALPSNGKKFDATGTALVAWNGSPESTYALRLSLPFLKTAESVRVVEVSDEDSAAEACAAVRYLARYDIAAGLLSLLLVASPANALPQPP